MAASETQNNSKSVYCEKSNELMMRYMDGLLDDFDAMNLNKHIESCKTCREDFAMYTEILQGIGGGLEIVEAPGGFEDAVMAQIEDIKIYFPAKVRNKGKIIDSILFVIWGLGASAFVLGGLMFALQDQIFAWLDYNGLYTTSAALRPFAAWITEFGASVAYYAAATSEWLAATMGAYWFAFVVAFGGLVSLAMLTMKMSPKYAKNQKMIK